MYITNVQYYDKKQASRGAPDFGNILDILDIV